MDLLTLLMIICLPLIGYKRGVVLEVGDWVLIILAGMAAFRGYRPLGKFLARTFKQFGVPFEEGLCVSMAFWSLGIFVAVMVLSGALHIDRTTREYDRIPKPVREYGGASLALLKALVLSTVLGSVFYYSDGLAAADKTALHRAESSRLLRGLGAPVGVLVAVICPSDIADKFRAAMSPNPQAPAKT